MDNLDLSRLLAVPLLTRHKTVLTYYPHLAPARGEQMALFGGRL